MWWKGRGEESQGKCKREMVPELNLKEEIGLASRQGQTERENPRQKDRESGIYTKRESKKSIPTRNALSVGEEPGSQGEGVC